mgnify:CR=1 FL=1
MIGPFEDKRPLALHHKILHYLHLSGSLEIFLSASISHGSDAAALPASRLSLAASLLVTAAHYKLMC